MYEHVMENVRNYQYHENRCITPPDDPPITFSAIESKQAATADGFPTGNPGESRLPNWSSIAKSKQQNEIKD